MRYKINVAIKALADIEESVAWYNEQLPGLGKRFKASVKAQINDLRDEALLYPEKYNAVHCRKIKSFPFLIHYIVKNNVVNVVAVFHTSRDPKEWLDRKL